MRTSGLAIALLLTLDGAACGQRLYWGVIGGTGLTSDFPRYDLSGPADIFGNLAYDFEHLPGPRRFILGGLFEMQLTNMFAIEADVLHRPLPAVVVYTEFPSSGPSVTSTNKFLAANTWEFPVMLKWTLPSPIAAERGRSSKAGRPSEPRRTIRPPCHRSSE